MTASSRSDRLLRAGVVLFAGVTAVLCGTAAVQLSGGATAPVILPLSDSWFARADARLHGPASPAALAAAARDTRRGLELSPARTDAWLKLAYVRSLETGGLDAEGRRLLAQSYAVGPLDPQVSLWRLRFSYEHWRALDPALRAGVRRELDAVWTRYPMRAALKETAAQVADPAGRLAMTAELKRLAIEEKLAKGRGAAR